MSILLSILIPTVGVRAVMLKRLMDRLQPQISAEVEVLTDPDDREMPIGFKRNRLVSRAGGDYTVFVDDDDLVIEKSASEPGYVGRILAAIAQKPDVVAISGIMVTDGDWQRARRFHHSIQHRTWFERDGEYFRNPNHLNPVRREIALETQFPAINFGEDRVYSELLLPKLKTEVVIPEPVYLYLHRRRKPEFGELPYPAPPPLGPRSPLIGPRPSIPPFRRD